MRGVERPLADMLGQLGRELEKANERVVESGSSGRLRWTEATIKLGVTWDKRGEGGIDLKVVRLGGGITKENTTTITVKVVPMESVPPRGSVRFGSAEDSKPSHRSPLSVSSCRPGSKPRPQHLLGSP